jgi:hypothetical protein
MGVQMTKGQNMQKKIITGLVSALIMGMGTHSVVFAANNVAPTVAPTVTPANNNINYNASAANLDGNKDVALPNANLPTSIPSPTVQNAVPMQPTNGLPQDAYGAGTMMRNGGPTDAVEATINILNTPNKRIREINHDLYSKGKTINESPVKPPKSANTVVVAHLSPNSVSPVVRVAKNRTTAIIMTDMTGQPWPIINYDGLSEEDFTVKRLDNPAPDGYVLSITPKGAFVSGNLTLVLKGLPSPISIDFISNQSVVDARTEIRVQGKGPNTQFTSIGLPDSMDTTLLSVLQGVAPAGSKELKVSSNAAQAWLAADGSMYVRTRYKVMAPAFEHVTSSPDGTYAYKMVAVPVVLYKATEGRFGEFAIEGF